MMSGRWSSVLALLLALVPFNVSAATLDAEMAAVERIRGLRFLAPVNTVELDRKELPTRLRAEFAKTLPYSVQEWGEVLRALRLIQEKDDEAIVSSLIDLYEAQVLAYYDPPSKTFFTIRQLPDAVKNLPFAGLDAGVKVHELTHALQDQHFNIGARDLALRNNSDANLAFHALIEGEASLVMLAYMIDQSGGSLDDMINSGLFGATIGDAAAANLPIGGPKYFSEMLKFPYLDGLRFVVEAYRRGGWKELDRVEQNPPRSTREVLHPDEYFAREAKPAPPVLLKPTMPSSLLSVEILGEWHWRFLTGSGEGWVADTVTIAENRFCEPTVLVDTMWDSETAARRFYDAYTKSLEDVGSLAAIGGKSVRVAYGADRAVMEHFISQ